jgi:PAS domain S-box-containing protein
MQFEHRVNGGCLDVGMGNEASDIRPQRLHFEVLPSATLFGLAVQIAQTIADTLGADHVSVTLDSEGGLHSGTARSAHTKGASAEAALFTPQQNKVYFNGHQWNLPLIVNDMQRARVPSELALELTVRKVRSCGIFPLAQDGRVYGVVECFFTDGYHRWRKEEVSAFDELAREIARYLHKPESHEHTPASYAAQRDESRAQYKRLARYGNVVILVTDAQFKITEVFGNTEHILGVSAAEMQRVANIWDVVLDPRDRTLLRRRITRLRLERDELREEVRVIHQRSGEVRWMMLRALPQFSAQGAFLGWEGFGIDVTDRRRAQESLVLQNRRLEALFEVARTIQGTTDPAMVMLKALRSLVQATGSRSGYGCLVHRPAGELELVAAYGLSEGYLAQMHQVFAGPSILRTAVDTRQGYLVDDFTVDPRAVAHLARFEGLKSGIIMPVMSDGVVYASITLMKADSGAYSEQDYELVSAAASQIALAVRQAEILDYEKRQGEALGALYRLSRELLKYRLPAEIAENAFPILQQEFSLKRGWIGVFNEAGTHIVGKGGFGPGVGRRLQEIQIERKLQHDFIDEAITTQRPVVCSLKQEAQCSGLNKLLDRLKADTIVIVPLVSLGQVVGLLAVEPFVSATFLSESRMQLLVSMSNEIATVLMARRFESKMAESLKMRMAGLLASGVAHNFNNMLQAVLGQTALIEMQAPKNPAVLQCTRTISEAAKRGAALTAQLLHFATQSAPSKQKFSIEKMLFDSRELYESLLGKRVTIKIIPDDAGSDIFGDTGQIQQAITNLLVNAKDAVASRERPMLTVSITNVKLRTGEVDPELPPGSYVRVDVKDNGIGMGQEAQARCFEPFFTTKNVDQATGVGISGAGLGLASAYSIVKQHAGLITVHSVPGEGSTFSVYLPRHDDAEEAGLSSEAVRSAGVDKSNVLLFGWESGVKPFVTSIFDSFGFSARSAYDVHQLSELIDEEPERWSYLVADLDAFSPKEVEIFTQLLAANPELSIIGAASNPKEWGSLVAQVGRLEVVEKPLGVWSVERAISRLRMRATVS